MRPSNKSTARIVIRAALVYSNLILVPEFPSCTNHSYLHVLKVVIIKVVCVSKDILEHNIPLIKEKSVVIKT